MGFWNWLFGKDKTAGTKKGVLIFSCVAVLLGTVGTGLGVYALTSSQDSKPVYKDHTFGGGQILIDNATSDVPLNLIYAYASAQYNITNNVSSLPSDTNITYTLESSHNPNIQILKDDSQWKLKINNGLSLGTYDFGITCSLHRDDYTDSNFTSNFRLFVNENNDLPTDGALLINGTSSSPTFEYSTIQTSGLSYTLSINKTLPPATTITYTKAGSLAQQTWWTIAGDQLTITNSNNGTPLACGSYALGVSINLQCNGYTSKTYIQNFNLIVNNSFRSNELFISTQTINNHPEYVVSAGTTLYYNGSTSAGSFGNDFFDLYAYAKDYASDLDELIEFYWSGGSPTTSYGFLIDPRFVNVIIDTEGGSSRNFPISPKPGYPTSPIAGMIIASKTASGNPSSFQGKLRVDSSVRFVVSNTATTGMTYGFLGGTFSGATLTVSAWFDVTNNLNDIRGIHINGTITNSTINFGSAITCNANGLRTSGATNASYGIYFNGSISGGNITVAPSMATYGSLNASGSAYGIYFAQDITANVLIGGSVMATSTYRGAAYDLYFAGTIGGNLANLTSGITLTIGNTTGSSVIKYSANNFDADKYTANTYGIVFNNTINSIDATRNTTITINNLQILSKSSNLAYGIQFNNAIGRYTTITENAEIDCYSSNNGSQYCVGFTNLTNGTITVRGVMNSYIANAYTNNGLIMGLQIAYLAKYCTFTYSGIMSLLYNPISADTSYAVYARGINVANAIESGASFTDTGIVNIRASAQIRGISVDGPVVAGSITLNNAIFNLIATATNIVAFYINRGEQTASITMTNVQWCLNANVTVQFFITATEVKPYKGTITSTNNIIYSSKTPSNTNSNWATSIFNVQWNNTTVSIGNDSAAASTAPANANITLSAINYLGTASTITTTIPVCSCLDNNFHFWIGVCSANDTQVKTFNTNFKNRFQAIYATCSANAQTVYWLKYANDTANTGWNIS